MIAPIRSFHLRKTSVSISFFIEILFILNSLRFRHAKEILVVGLAEIAGRGLHFLTDKYKILDQNFKIADNRHNTGKALSV